MIERSERSDGLKHEVTVRRQIDAVIGPAVSAIGVCVFVAMILRARLQPIEVLFSAEYKRSETFGLAIGVAIFALGIVIATIEQRVKQREREANGVGSSAPPPSLSAAPAVKVRCRGCAQLNDESARFCQGCGAAL